MLSLTVVVFVGVICLTVLVFVGVICLRDCPWRLHISQQFPDLWFQSRGGSLACIPGRHPHDSRGSLNRRVLKVGQVSQECAFLLELNLLLVEKPKCQSILLKEFFYVQ